METRRSKRKGPQKCPKRKNMLNPTRKLPESKDKSISVDTKSKCLPRIRSPQPSTSGQVANKTKASMKVFEVGKSSRSTTPDPYSDDGEFGSDGDYDPIEDDQDSDSTVSGLNYKRKKPTSPSKKKPEQASSDLETENSTKTGTESERSESECSESESSESEYSSSESIFDTHRTRKRSRSTSPLEPKSKKPKLLDEDADTISMTSETLINNVGNALTTSTSLLQDPSELENVSFLHSSFVNDDLRMPAPYAAVELEDSFSFREFEPERQPTNEEVNVSSRESMQPPPEPIDREAIPALREMAPPPLEPVDREANPSPREMTPPPLEPVDREANPSPREMTPPLPEPLDREANPSPREMTPPPPEPVDREANPSPREMTPPPPEPVDREANPSPREMTPPPPEPVDREANPSPREMTPPPPETVDREANPSPREMTPPPPELLDREANPSPREMTPPPPEPVDREVNPSLREMTPPPLEPIDRQRNPSSVNAQQQRRRRQPSRQEVQLSDDDWEHSTTTIPIFDFDYSSAGVQIPIDRNTTVMDIFDKLFPPHIVEYIVERTNAYGRALCAADRPTTRNSRRFSYRDTNREEMLTFLGLCLLMGQVNIPQKRKNFTYSDPLYFHPIFPHAMSGRRFEQILRCLCVSELNAKGKDKVLKFIDAMTKNFMACYKPSKELSLDESLLLFRGRLVFRQYIKNKKVRYGIKFYELTTSDGYVLNIIMYTGKNDNNHAQAGKITEKLVMRLMRPYLLKGHWLFMDNYYNSVNLSQKLLDLKTHTTGTLRTNRKGNPKNIVKKKLKRNQHVWVRKNKVYVSKWVDKRPVLMVTTANHPKLIEVSNRHGQRRMKPEEVAVYNMHMSGIDRSDQMVSYYSSPRKTLRWYKKVFFHILDICVWNSFYLYRKYCQNSDFLSFREQLIRRFLKITTDLKPDNLIKHNRFDNRLKERTDIDQSAIVQSAEMSGHWPEKIPVRTGSKKTSNYMKCKMCTKKKVRKETCIRCKSCPEKPALCALCFEEWHVQA